MDTGPNPSDSRETSQPLTPNLFRSKSEARAPRERSVPVIHHLGSPTTKWLKHLLSLVASDAGRSRLVGPAASPVLICKPDFHFQRLRAESGAADGSIEWRAAQISVSARPAGPTRTGRESFILPRCA